MKNFLKIWLIAILPLFANAQTVTGEVKITLPTNLVTTEQMESYVKKAIQDAGGNVPVVPVLDNCKKGPFVYDITDISANYLKLRFDGEEVIRLVVVISQNTKLIQADTISPSGNTIKLAFNKVLTAGTYTLRIAGVSCKGGDFRDFQIKDSGVVPEPDPDPVSPSEGYRQIGAETKIIGGRKFTYNLTGKAVFEFNPDGTITDVTPGIEFKNGVYKLGDKNVFYMDDYKVLEGQGKSFNSVNKLYLPDGIHTIGQFICDANEIPDVEEFKKRIVTQWPGQITWLNSTMSQMYLSIKTIDAAPTLSIVPRWLEVSRRLNFPAVGTEKDLKPYGKWYATTFVNQGQKPEVYHRIGANTSGVIPRGFITARNTNATVSESDLLGQGRGMIEASGNSDRFILTDEIPENQGGHDPKIRDRMHFFYQGAFQQLKATNPNITARKSALYGPYGEDQFQFNILTNAINWSKSDYIAAYTKYLYQSNDPATGNWGDTTQFLKADIDWRNLNYKEYNPAAESHFVYKFIATHERVKLQTKTFRGIDKERGLILFSWPKTENFQADAQGNRTGVEMSNTGEVIRYKDGLLLSRPNSDLEIPAPWGEVFNNSFWATLIGDGVLMWNGGGVFPSDTTKYYWWGNTEGVKWKRNGSNSFDQYISSQNGAPENLDGVGLSHRLMSAASDASYAGMEAWWSIRDRVTTLKHVAYKSNVGGFTPASGSTGFHLNGFGPLNLNQYNIKDIYDAKSGISLRGSGIAGDVLIYYNGFLSPNQFEDVTIDGVFIGRCYGRQTYAKKL